MTNLSLSPDMIVSGLAVGWAVSLPFLPDTFFPLLDGVIGVFVLLMVALLALPQGPLPGILTLAAVALTFVERNRRKVASKLLTEDVPNLETQLAPSPPMSNEEVHPEFEESMQDETSFYPQEEQSDGFEPVAESINEKVALPTISTNEGTSSATRFFLNQHLAKTDLE
jgi:hypothetical protein